MPTTKTAKGERKRCLNCNKLFVPRPNLGDRAKFCKKECCDEFHRHGSAFGPMKAGLYKAIEKKYAELDKEVTVRLKAVVVRNQLDLSALAVELKELRAQVDALRGQSGN